MKLNAIRSEYLLKIYSDVVSLIHYERIKIEQENVNLSEYEIVDVEIPLDSKQLFEMFELFYKHFSGEYLKFVMSIFNILDKVEYIESIKSVTDISRESVYRSVANKKNLKESDFKRISKITLLDHIWDILEIIDEDMAKDVLTKSEGQHLMILALIHDIGKIMPLMMNYGINKSSGGHEARGRIFIDMLLEGSQYSNELSKPLKRIAKNMLNLDTGETNGTISRFREYDERARVNEMIRLKKEDNGEDK